MRLARRWAQDCERGFGQCIPQGRRNRCGYARDPAIAAARPHQTEGPGEDRARLDEARPVRALDRLESLAHLAWPPTLLRAQTRLLKLRGFSALSEWQNFSANGPGKEAGQDCLTRPLSGFGRVDVARRTSIVLRSFAHLPELFFELLKLLIGKLL